MIGGQPDFIKSPYFYIDKDGWHLKPGAPTEVQAEFDDYMTAQAEYVKVPGSK